jgi:hypothetical protein
MEELSFGFALSDPADSRGSPLQSSSPDLYYIVHSPPPKSIPMVTVIKAA